MNTWSSSVLCASIASTTGASLTGRTDTVNEACPVAPSISVAITVTRISPLKSWSGVSVTSEPSTLTEPLPSTVALKVITSRASTSLPETVKIKLPSSKILSFAIAFTLGASLRLLMVNVKLVAVDKTPSLATTVTRISPE